MPSTTQIIYENGRFQELTVHTTESRRVIALPSELIKAQQKSTSTLIRNVFKVSSHPATLISHSSGSCCYIIPLAGVPWKQYYLKTEKINDQYNLKGRRPYLVANGWQTPLDKSSGELVDTVSTTLFGPTSPFKAFIALTYGSSGNYSSRYLFIGHQASGELYVPPLPNIFSDGRICMGQTFDNNPTNGYIDHASIATHTLTSFSSSIWGAHLVTHYTDDFCTIDENNRFLHESSPITTCKYLQKNAPAFLGKWTPSHNF